MTHTDLVEELFDPVLEVVFSGALLAATREDDVVCNELVHRVEVMCVPHLVPQPKNRLCRFHGSNMPLSAPYAEARERKRAAKRDELVAIARRAEL